MEEAALIANEFVSSLDNLPNEVQFLLKEIKAKDVQAYDIQSKLSVRTATPAKVASDYEKIDRLSDEKIVLAERLLQLMKKSCGRLDYDLARVRVASGDVPFVADPAPVAHRSTAVDKVVNNLRSALGTPEPGGSSQGAAAGQPQKKRRLNSGMTGTVNNAPVTLTHVPSARSRLSSQMQTRPSPPVSRRGRASAPPDEDFEMEEDADDGGDDNGDQDDQEYCFCRKMSYGEMIACDNVNCAYEWFHLGCVGLKPPVPQTWYCSECVRTLGLSDDSGGTAGTEKGRKGRRR